MSIEGGPGSIDPSYQAQNRGSMSPKKKPGWIKTILNKILAPITKAISDKTVAKFARETDSPKAKGLSRIKEVAKRIQIVPKLTKRKVRSEMREKLIAHFEERAGRPLDSHDLFQIDVVIETMKRVDRAIKFRAKPLSGARSDIKVRSTLIMPIANQVYDVEIGRNYKVAVMRPEKDQKVLGEGTFGEVKLIGKRIKAGRTIVEKLSKSRHPQTEAPADMQREFRVAQDLHQRAGGRRTKVPHQRGVQRAPYSMFNKDGNFGYLAPGYQTDLCNLDQMGAEAKETLHLDSDRSMVRGFTDVLTGLKAMHAAGYVHRDIKPENMGLQIVDGESEWALADLGMATDEANELRGHAGTRWYMSADTMQRVDTRRQEIWAEKDEFRKEVKELLDAAKFDFVAGQLEDYISFEDFIYFNEGQLRECIEEGRLDGGEFYALRQRPELHLQPSERAEFMRFGEAADVFATAVSFIEIYVSLKYPETFNQILGVIDRVAEQENGDLLSQPEIQTILRFISSTDSTMTIMLESMLGPTNRRPSAAEALEVFEAALACMQD